MAAKTKEGPIIFLIGAPGSGKGTQCLKVAAKYGYTHLSVGDLIRGEIASKSARGLEMERKRAAKEPAHLNTLLDILDERVETAVKAGSKGFLVDGHWTAEQSGAFEARHSRATLVINLYAPDALLTSRLLARGKKSGRADDAPEVIQQRLKSFQKWAPSAIAAFEKRGVLVRIDAAQSEEAVFSNICVALDKALAPKK